MLSGPRSQVISVALFELWEDGQLTEDGRICNGGDGGGYGSGDSIPQDADRGTNEAEVATGAYPRALGYQQMACFSKGGLKKSR